jgi:hypothetical protein
MKALRSPAGEAFIRRLLNFIRQTMGQLGIRRKADAHALADLRAHFPTPLLREEDIFADDDFSAGQTIEQSLASAFGTAPPPSIRSPRQPLAKHRCRITAATTETQIRMKEGASFV